MRAKDVFTVITCVCTVTYNCRIVAVVVGERVDAAAEPVLAAGCSHGLLPGPGWDRKVPSGWTSVTAPITDPVLPFPGGIGKIDAKTKETDG